MPQSTIELVKNLIVRLSQFKALSQTFDIDLPESDAEFSVSLSYSRLRFNIGKQHVVYFQYTTQYDAPDAATAECYYLGHEKTDVWKAHFAPLASAEISNPGIRNPELEEGHAVEDTPSVDRYLTIAESIARCAYHCTSGDDYRPGYFSEIIVTSESITLQQINHMHARSLDHKNSYSLRDLEFFIPVSSSPEDKFPLLSDDHIGTMHIMFSDRSSLSNRTCGDRILEKIAEEKAAFLQL